MVATPRSEAEISKKITDILKAIKNDGQTKKTTVASQLPTPLCYSARVGNIRVGGLLWLFHLQAAQQK